MQAVSKVEKRILQVVAPHALSLDFEIVRVRVSSSGKGKTSQVQIMAEPRQGQMKIEDCVALSRAIGPALTAQDAISGEYELEVSSPGIDRPLTRHGDFARWVGHLVKVETIMPIEGRRRFGGQILEENDGVARLALTGGGELELSLSEMSRAELVLTDALIDALRVPS